MLLHNFRAICGSTPDALAVVAGAQRLSYDELDQRSTRMACKLSAAGLAQGALVAIHLPRNEAVIPVMLGILKCGAAYTVVEDDGVSEEHRTRLQQIAADLVVCDGMRAAALRDGGLRTLGVEELDAAEAASPSFELPSITPDDVAYVLFTSGSTGTPKGVSVTHANIAHYIEGIRGALDVQQGLSYAHVSTLAADLGNTSLLLSLATGGCLHLIDAHLRKDPVALRDYLIEHSIDFLKITPTHWNAITSNLGPDGLRGLRLRCLVLGGEALTVTLARKILESGATEVLSNHYGPTEATVGVTTYPMRSIADIEEIASECVPIGRPIGQTRLRVRDDNGVVASRGASGELFIGGPSVSAGYRNEPALTEAAFQQLADEDGCFYRTGDYVAIDDNGVALFLGRIDRQVKINGYRVELEHVENVMRSLPEVEDAAIFFVDVRGKKRLVAAMLARDGASVRPQLERMLPEHMVPRHVLCLGEFARNANGKTDMKALERQVRRLANESPSPSTGSEESSTSPLHSELRTAWRRYIHTECFGEDDSFFDVGGDSLDAIELIADLQLKGHAVTAHAFLSRPTINGLVAAIARARAKVAPAVHRPTTDLSRKLSAAQSFFLRQRLVDADHYNQALLLAADPKLDAEVMHKAITELLQRHPALRTAYRQDADGFCTVLMDDGADDAFEMVFVRKSNDESVVRRRIESVSESAHQSLSLSDGHLFKARLFKFDARADLILLVAHHIAIDVVSWRILVTELGKLYHDLIRGRTITSPVQSSSFQEWVAHLDEHHGALLEKGPQWPTAATTNGWRESSAAFDPRNTEGEGRTLWLGYSQAETRAIAKGLQARAVPLHVALLAAFASGYAQQNDLRGLIVDVESHGRVTLDDTIDISRVVGWHTSTYPVELTDVRDGIQRTATSTATALAGVSDLGVLFGLQEKQLAVDPARVSASICYNFLGTVDFANDAPVTLTPSPYSIGRARGADNHRGHAMKLSGRVIEERLLVDLSYPGTTSDGEMGEVMKSLDRELRVLAGLSDSIPEPCLLLEPGTRTGLITYAPKALVDAAETVRRDYQTILFTGATGFVGAHVLHELLERSDARILCIVRSTAEATASQRLTETFEFYFPTDARTMLDDRVVVVDGDVSAPRLGLDDTLYSRLALETDAIYHFAADTRLFGPEDEFERSNVFSVRQCIGFAQTGRVKDLHYMSTLAVCGVNPREEAIEFSENCADVGQEFQNHYEATKFRAERLVQGFRDAGGGGFIYRSGNVSGHSRTARFQRNAKDNRFVQFLSACVKAGTLPRSYDESIVLSPIDEVAAGIAAISLDHSTHGGVFHVDSMHALRVKQVFDALENIGISFECSEHASFSTLFSELVDRGRGCASERDPELSLGLFWALRKQRNVRFNNASTHELMARLRCSFSVLDDTWIKLFVSGLADDGVFAGPTRAHAQARSAAKALEHVA